MVPVLMVSKVKITLIQKKLQAESRRSYVFVVYSPIWNDLIIGVNTLEANGVTLQLKHAPKSEENT
eukprot:snap_masked-scaffold_87-processed-gene-0.5-mRNA-1 protein AED:1.00 eAED:1.00 QI:0/-1/0/0/-1/1/1/0/65